MPRRHRFAAAALLALLPAMPAFAGALPPPGMLPDASNALLPNAVQGLGVLSGVVNARTTAYTVQNSDQGGTIVLGGNAFYTLTVNSPASYTNGSRMYFVAVNSDTGRAKNLSINGASYMIWPGQSRFILPDGSGGWKALGGFSQRWRLAAGTTNFYTDYTNGSDVAGANDCLAPGAGNACKSVQGWLSNVVNNQLDFDGALPTEVHVVANLAANSTDAALIHWSPHPGAPGAQGYATFTVDGGGTATLAGDGIASGVVQLYAGAVLQFQNLTIAPSAVSSDCVQVIDHGIFVLGPGVTFSCNGSGVFASKGGRGYLQTSSFTISKLGASGDMLNAGDGGIIDQSGGTVTLGANITAAAYANAALTSAIDTSGITSSIRGLAAMFGSGSSYSSGGTSDAFPNQVGAGYTGGTTFTNHGVLYGQGGGVFGATAAANNALVTTGTAGVPQTVAPTTVAGLGTCDAAHAGWMQVVTDALSPAYGGTLTGGSTSYAVAVCNGSAWKAL
jgi:hypothetical protein